MTRKGRDAFGWRLTKATWNERIKLLATTVNGAGLAFLGVGVLGPLLASGQHASGVQYALSIAIFVTAHGFAQWTLRWLEE